MGEETYGTPSLKATATNTILHGDISSWGRKPVGHCSAAAASASINFRRRVFHGGRHICDTTGGGHSPQPR